MCYKDEITNQKKSLTLNFLCLYTMIFQYILCNELSSSSLYRYIIQFCRAPLSLLWCSVHDNGPIRRDSCYFAHFFRIFLPPCCCQFFLSNLRNALIFAVRVSFDDVLWQCQWWGCKRKSMCEICVAYFVAHSTLT